MAKKILYKQVTAELHSKATKNPLTVDEAKELLGWEETDHKTDYDFRDMDGNKVKLRNNPSNRPFRMILAKRYANEHLRGKWKLNGESCVFDRYGQCQSAQHRLTGFIFAEQMRKQGKGPKGFWKGPVMMECLVVLGIHEDAADTLDMGQKRSLGDVIFRRAEFKDASRSEQKKLANHLSHAIRLVWLRSGGKKISDAPFFPHSEALEFFEEHPRLLECVKFIYDLEGGRGAEGGRISKRVSPGYAAALLYLAGHSATDPAKFIEDGVEVLDDSLMEKAEDFWTIFASGANLDEGSPILHLRELLIKIDAQSGAGRDDVVGACIKAMNLYFDDPKATCKATDVKVKKKKDKESGKMVLNEDEPRLGGMDVPVEEFIDADAEEEEAEEFVQQEDTSKRGKRSKGGWAKGDKAWVKDPDDEHWFGTIDLISDDGKTAYMVADLDGAEWEAPVAMLWKGYPPEGDTAAKSRK